MQNKAKTGLLVIYMCLEEKCGGREKEIGGRLQLRNLPFLTTSPSYPPAPVYGVDIPTTTSSIGRQVNRALWHKV